MVSTVELFLILKHGSKINAINNWLLPSHKGKPFSDEEFKVLDRWMGELTQLHGYDKRGEQ